MAGKYNLDVNSISKDEWEYNNCREYAIYIITNYSKTEKQLRDKLKMCKKKYSIENIDKTISFLKEHKYLDDENFAKRFIELHKNSYSKKILKNKLIEKGVNREILLKVFSDDNVEFDEISTIKKVLLKKYKDYYEVKDEMDIKEKQKVFAFLYRKGFSYENIEHVLNSKG